MTVNLTSDQADSLPETDASNELFNAKYYSTRALAAELSTWISALPYNREAGSQMWDEYEANADGSQDAPFWYRGSICRYLAHLNATLCKINFRHS